MPGVSRRIRNRPSNLNIHAVQDHRCCSGLCCHRLQLGVQDGQNMASGLLNGSSPLQFPFIFRYAESAQADHRRSPGQRIVDELVSSIQ